MRFNQIDFLRAAAIIAVVVIHVFSYNSVSQPTVFIWNYLHFIIVAFIFCAGYVWMHKYQGRFNGFISTVSWYKKRLIRLMVPYYWYLFASYIIWFLFPNLFAGLGLHKSAGFLVQSMFLTGGVDLNWLVLLFVQLTVSFPILIKIIKSKLLTTAYIFIAFGITFFLTFNQFPHDWYRYIMWLPWSLILLLSMFLYKREQQDKKEIQTQVRYALISFAGMIIFMALFFLGRPPNGSLRLIDHKYPPDWYYLSYETAITFAILLASFLPFFKYRVVVMTYQYISQNSYRLYFAHFIVLDIVLKMMGNGISLGDSVMRVVIILPVSLSICWLIDRSKFGTITG